MDVFLSHSAADKKLAERLTKGLEGRGLSVWLDEHELSPDSDWQHEIEKAIRSARNVVLLFDRQRKTDNVQEFTWRAALEAAWEDARKRLIPVLRRGADLPKFVLSGSAGDDVRVVRLEDARVLGGAVEDIVKLANGGTTGPNRARLDDDPKPTGFPVDADTGLSFEVGAVRSVDPSDADHEAPPKTGSRSKRLDEIARYAATLK